MSYYFSKTLHTSFEKAVELTIEALKKEGFGVISTIDVQEAMRNKLGEEFRPYKILGTCNPSYAFKALGVEDKIGTLLPCNVIIQQHPDGRVEAAAVDPFESMKAVQNPALGKIAAEVRKKLSSVIDGLEKAAVSGNGSARTPFF